MGNIITSNNNKQVDISSTIPYLEKMTNDAQTLIKHLKVPELDDLVFSDTENFDKYQIFQKNNNSIATDNLSDTSPFISEENYKKLMKGGATVGGATVGGAMMEMDSDEDGSTSSSEEDMKKKSKKNSKKEKYVEDLSEEMNKLEDDFEDELEEDIDMDMEEMDSEDMEMDNEEDDESYEMSTGSYLSSSAHTDGVSSAITTISIGNNKVLSESIHTSDINMISIEE